jgi:hypothetical protein
MDVTNGGGRRRGTRKVSLLLKRTRKWLLQEREERVFERLRFIC